MPQAPDNTESFSSLVKVIEDLRGPDGCPWDKQQTHQSLTPHALEEVAELVQAIDRGKTPEIIEELGDVLLQVVLHAEIARQNGEFDIHDVIRCITEKMIRRHPHVFGDVKASTTDEAWAHFNAAKAKEKKPTQTTGFSGFDLPPALPALLAAQKLGQKTKVYHFDWSMPEEVLKKVKEELAELEEAMDQHEPDHIESEIGDLLFSVTQLARHLHLDAEQALRRMNQRFEGRFSYMHQRAAEQSQNLKDLSAEQLESLWQEAKRHSR